MKSGESSAHDVPQFITHLRWLRFISYCVFKFGWNEQQLDKSFVCWHSENIVWNMILKLTNQITASDSCLRNSMVGMKNILTIILMIYSTEFLLVYFCDTEKKKVISTANVCLLKYCMKESKGLRRNLKDIVYKKKIKIFRIKSNCFTVVRKYNSVVIFAWTTMVWYGKL